MCIIPKLTVRGVSSKQKAALPHRVHQPLMRPVRVDGQDLVVAGSGVSRQQQRELVGLACEKLFLGEIGSLPVSDAPDIILGVGILGEPRQEVPMFGVDDELDIRVPELVEGI